MVTLAAPLSLGRKWLSKKVTKNQSLLAKQAIRCYNVTLWKKLNQTRKKLKSFLQPGLTLATKKIDFTQKLENISIAWLME